MLKGIKEGFRKRALLTAGALVLFGSWGDAQIEKVATYEQSVTELESWRMFHSVPGKCNISLPSQPEHVKQVMPLAQEGYHMRYDVYVSAHKREAVYMVLIAEYPPYVDDSFAELSLESFLNGLVNQGEGSRLLFADMTEVQGNKALDFFIETKGVYFKGRAIMAKNHLYLIAMECEVNNYEEAHYDHFVNSFKIHM